MLASPRSWPPRSWLRPGHRCHLRKNKFWSRPTLRRSKEVTVRLSCGGRLWNDRNERIGTIPDVVIGQDDVPFVILEVGSFLGLGAHMVAVPFKTLKIDEAGRKIVLPDATRDALKNFPEFRFPR